MPESPENTPRRSPLARIKDSFKKIDRKAVKGIVGVGLAVGAGVTEAALPAGSSASSKAPEAVTASPAKSFQLETPQDVVQSVQNELRSKNGESKKESGAREEKNDKKGGEEKNAPANTTRPNQQETKPSSDLGKSPSENLKPKQEPQRITRSEDGTINIFYASSDSAVVILPNGDIVETYNSTSDDPQSFYTPVGTQVDSNSRDVQHVVRGEYGTIKIVNSKTQTAAVILPNRDIVESYNISSDSPQLFYNPAPKK